MKGQPFDQLVSIFYGLALATGVEKVFDRYYHVISTDASPSIFVPLGLLTLIVGICDLILSHSV